MTGFQFFGDNFSAAQCERVYTDLWTEDQRKRDIKVLPNRWFDVRQLHPVKATYLLGHLFTEQVRGHIRMTLNPTLPSVNQNGKTIDWHPIKKGDYFSPPASTSETKHKLWKRKINALIRARQTADQFGIPYEIVARTGVGRIYFGAFDRLADGFIGKEGEKRNKMPDPTCLNGERALYDMCEAWLSALQTGIQYGKNAMYLVSSGVINQDTIEHQDWLVSQLKKKSDPSRSIINLLKSDLISRETVVAAFGPTALNLA